MSESKVKKVFLGADHGGFELKEKIKSWLEEWELPYEDKGALTVDPEDDYPDFAFAVAESVAEDHINNKGVLACRSAAGMVIAANKVTNVRAITASKEIAAQHSREHNDANVISLSGDWLSDEEAKAILKTFLFTDFSHEDRHQRRLDKISNYS